MICKTFALVAVLAVAGAATATPTTLDHVARTADPNSSAVEGSNFKNTVPPVPRDDTDKQPLILSGPNCTIRGVLVSHGRNVVLNCNATGIVFMPGASIDTSGVPGLNYAACAATGGPGAQGYRGLAGRVGGDGGNVTLIADEIIGLVTLNAGGGSGGAGQCGGAGGTGLTGANGVPVTDCDCGCGGIGSCDSCDLTGGAGQPGGTGGHGGVGADGGRSGNGGHVTIYAKPPIKISEINTDAGAGGAGGAAGAPGAGGVGGPGGHGWHKHRCNRCTSGMESKACCPGATGGAGSGGGPGTAGATGPQGLAGFYVILPQHSNLKNSVPPAPSKFPITVQCTTDETGGSGERHDCDSAPSAFTAPAGAVIIPQSVANPTELSGNGDKHCADCSFANFVESPVMPGVYWPLTITMQAHATSPSGHWSGRGWETARFDITTIPMANLTAAPAQSMPCGSTC